MPKAPRRAGTTASSSADSVLVPRVALDTAPVANLVEAAHARKVARRREAGAAAARNFSASAYGDDDADGGGAGGGAGGDDDGDGFVPRALSARIVAAARAQVDDADEEDARDAEKSGKRRARFAAPAPRAAVWGTSRRTRAPAADFDEDDDDDGGDDDDDDDGDADSALDLGDDGEFEGGTGVFRDANGDFVSAAPDFDADGAEAAVLARFMPTEAGARRTLADMIMEKLAEVGEGDAEGGGGGGGGSGSALDPKVIEVFTEVGRFLAGYKSGKVPKVFKVIPSLSNWEEVLFLTNPETWTPHATFAATRLFASNLNAAKAQRFFALVLLPKCRDDIFAHKRLNFHLYLALRKATYKPAAFYKGILLPLAAGGDCTLREALIIGSVVAKASIPSLHSAAALYKLAADTPYSGSVSIFMRQLVAKKYALPFLVIDALVAHFVGFVDERGPLPVIWHQALLELVQRYRADITREQKDALRALVTTHSHAGIAPEVKRELAVPGSRGDVVPPAAPRAAGSGAVKKGGFASRRAKETAAPAAGEMEY